MITKPERSIGFARRVRKRLHAAKVARQRVADTEHGSLIITRTRRAVRVTVETRTPTTAVAFVDLTDEEIDRTIERLQALRGGKRVLP